jgi:hypothetical protein
MYLSIRLLINSWYSTSCSIELLIFLKIEIREATIIYCKSKSKFKREARRSLEKELQDSSSHRDSLDITDDKEKVDCCYNM